MQMSKFKNKQKYLINVVIHIPYNIGIYIGIWIIGSEVLRLILDLLIILAILINVLMVTTRMPGQVDLFHFLSIQRYGQPNFKNKYTFLKISNKMYY